MATGADRFARFLKFMELTRSEHDNEALTALRRANAMLVEQNMNWEDLLRARVKFNTTAPVPDIERKTTDTVNTAGRHTNAQEIEPMFELLQATVHDSFRIFIDSIYKYWQDKHYLSSKQYDAIKSAYDSRV